MSRFISLYIMVSFLIFGLSYSGMVYFGSDSMDHGMTQDLECINHCISTVVNQTLIPINLVNFVLLVVVYSTLLLVAFVLFKNYLFVWMDSIGIYLRQRNFQTIILRE